MKEKIKKLPDPELTHDCKPRELTDKQSRYIEARMSGAPKQKAVQIAGYKHENTPAATIEKSPAVKNALINALATIGVGEKYLARKLREGLASKDFKFFSLDGKVTDERVVADYAVREKYLRTALEVLGYIRVGNEVRLNLGVIALSSEKLNQSDWNSVESEIEKSKSPSDSVSVEQDSVRL